MLFDNGVNLQPSYYNGGAVDFAWEEMQQVKKIRTLRIEIEPYAMVQARSWIQQACSRGYEVIATFHNHLKLASDHANDLMAAANWWVDNYASLLSGPAMHQVKPGDTLQDILDTYYSTDPNVNHYQQQILNYLNSTGSSQLRPGQWLVIPASPRKFTINVCNEWGSHKMTAKQYAEAYNTACKTIRKVYLGPLILDVPGSGQETAVAASAAKGFDTGGVKLTDTDIVFSVHIYKTAYVAQRNAALIGPKTAAKLPAEGPMETQDLDDLASAGRPCIVGEFGEGDQSKTAAPVARPAKWDGLVDYARKTLHWPVLGWAWNGCGQGMNMMRLPNWNSSALQAVVRDPQYFNKIHDHL